MPAPSFFALAPNHTPLDKSTPALIAHDDRRFAEIDAAVRAQRDDVAERLDRRRGEAARPGWEALDRDVDVHRLNTRSRLLARYGADLCLGRIVPADGGEPLYIGRQGLSDADGRRLLVDWRAPAAAPFFAATPARPGGWESRRRYRWSAGRVVDYWDDVFGTGPLHHPAAPDDDSALLASLAEARTPRMRDVLASIQADQDAVIRSPLRGTLVVDGGPGTGKTVVALHRAAYLMHAHEAVLRSGGGVLFVGPHPAFLRYVEDVLPNLGEDGVRLSTLGDMVSEGAGAVPERDPAVAALKGSTVISEAILRAVATLTRTPREVVEVLTPWADVRVPPAVWEQAFGAADPAATHNDARDEVFEELTDLVTHLVRDAGAEEVPPEHVRRVVQRDEDLRRTFAQAWPLQDPADLVAGLWSSPARLAACAPELSADEVALLQRPAPTAWTHADLPLLDAARVAVGDPALVRERRRVEVEQAADRAVMELVIDDLLASDEDGRLAMLAGQDLRNSLEGIDRAVRRTPEQLTGPFAHIIVDEAQELTDAQWRMLRRRCPSRSMTIVGDRAQARQGFSETWTERLERIGLRGARTETLSVNYRTPAEVMAVAEPIIRAALPEANVPTSVRSSGLPVREGRVDDLAAIVADWTLTHAEGTVGVVTAEPARAPGLDAVRVRVVTPVQAKGLEFDLVIVVDPESFGTGITGAVDRYVAITRSTSELVILTE